jgi:hypothetical protein
MSAYTELKAACLPLLEAYHDDLVKHDRQFIEDNPGVPFLHQTRKSGTTMIPLWPAEAYPAKGEYVPFLFGTADREHILQGVTDMAEYVLSPVALKTLALHYYDGSILRSVTGKRFLELAWEHRRRIERQWEVGTVAGQQPKYFVCL